MSYYDILEVSPKASKEVIRNAYRALAKKYHPDMYKVDITFAQQKMKDINEAYEVLIDEDKRLKYDYDNGFKIDSEQVVQNYVKTVNNIRTNEVKENSKKINKSKAMRIACIIIGVIVLFGISIFIGMYISALSETKQIEEIEPSTNEVKPTENNKYSDTNNKLNNGIGIPVTQEENEYKNTEVDNQIDTNVVIDTENKTEVEEQIEEPMGES